MSVSRVLRVSGPVAFGLFVVLAIVVSSGGACAAPGEGATVAGTTVPGNGPCTLPILPANFSGTVLIEGGPLAATSPGGIGIVYSYFEQVDVRYVPNGTLASENCVLETDSSVTNATGGFAVDILAPATTCSSGSPGGEECTSYSAPFGALSVATANVPPGYGLSVDETGSSYVLGWVADLAVLSLTPAPPLATFASGASVSFVARPEMANGSASPVHPTFSWVLEGSGYQLLSPPENGSATVVAGTGWSNGTLLVGASVTVGPYTFLAPNITVALATVPTTISEATVNRTVVDAGGTVALTVSGSGAAGYPYTLSVAPGFVAEPSVTPCTTVPALSGSVAVHCGTELIFPTPGTGTVSINVSNGPSSAPWVSPIVTVAPPPALSLSPSAPAGYAGAALPVDLVAASGVGPYSVACFAPGFGGPSCLTGPGPSWTFAPTYPSAGNYSARAWLLDATGTNHSISVRVRVVDPLAMGSLEVGTAAMSAGVPTILTASIEGGVLPAEVWWNASGEARPINTTVVTTDGLLSTVFLPPDAGTTRLSVTVVDALGTVAQAVVTVRIGPGPVASVTPVPALGNVPTVVGQPMELAWHAFDALGEPIDTFAAPVDLVVRAETGTVALSWVNLSALGPLSTAPEGSFAIPASAWDDGVLPLTFTPAEAGSLTLTLEGSALPGGDANLILSATPDLDHLRLYDPVVASAGAYTNQTFWHVSDKFGDPAPGAFVTVQYIAPGAESDTVLPVGWYGSEATGVWVNYTLPSTGVATVRVLDLAGDVLYGPVGPPMPATAPVPVATLAGTAMATGLVVGVGGGSFAFARRRRTLRRLPRSEEEELRRLAEGRAEAVEIVRSLGVADLVALRNGWSHDAPPTEELEEWLASLVADGTLSEATGPAGRPEYALGPPGEMEPR
ncbi:MAG: hypothetical protein ABSB97_02195, partial [Thermoplasmata archaeon]